MQNRLVQRACPTVRMSAGVVECGPRAAQQLRSCSAWGARGAPAPPAAPGGCAARQQRGLRPGDSHRAPACRSCSRCAPAAKPEHPQPCAPYRTHHYCSLALPPLLLVRPRDRVCFCRLLAAVVIIQLLTGVCTEDELGALDMHVCPCC